jgi:NADH:ubiquinone oxidoreductase subunit C
VLKARVYGREAPSLPSVTGVWVGAELQEREIFDLMGVAFEDHPNLKRLLTWEGFDGHPLRRDYLEPPLPYTWPQGG